MEQKLNLNAFISDEKNKANGENKTSTENETSENLKETESPILTETLAEDGKEPTSFKLNLDSLKEKAEQNYKEEKNLDQTVSEVIEGETETNKTKSSVAGKKAISEVSDKLGVLTPDEENDFSKIVSKISVEDEIKEATEKADDKEIFINYEAEVVEDKPKEKEKKPEIEGSKFGDSKGTTQEEEAKKKGKGGFIVLLIIILLLVIIGGVGYYFKDKIKERFFPVEVIEEKIPTTLVENPEENPEDNLEDNPEDNSSNNNSGTVVEKIPTTGYKPLTREERQIILKNKIIEIYLGKEFIEQIDEAENNIINEEVNDKIIEENIEKDLDENLNENFTDQMSEELKQEIRNLLDKAIEEDNSYVE